MIKFINNRYGSKKGFLRYVKYQLIFYLGMYKPFTEIDFSRVKRFVFVCSGNICRSALAEAVIEKCGGNACSFGLDTRGGDPADPRMVLIGKELGFDLSEHSTCRVNQCSVHSGDLLIGMEPEQCRKLRSLYPDNQVTSLGVWSGSKKVYIHDPYSANNVYFARCAEEIVFAAGGLFKHFKNRTV